MIRVKDVGKRAEVGRGDEVNEANGTGTVQVQSLFFTSPSIDYPGAGAGVWVQGIRVMFGFGVNCGLSRVSRLSRIEAEPFRRGLHANWGRTGAWSGEVSTGIWGTPGGLSWKLHKGVCGSSNSVPSPFQLVLDSPV